MISPTSKSLHGPHLASGAGIRVCLWLCLLFGPTGCGAGSEDDARVSGAERTTVPAADVPREVDPELRATVEARVEEAQRLRKALKFDEALAFLEDTELPAPLAAVVLKTRGEILFLQGLAASEGRVGGVSPQEPLRRAETCLREVIEKYPAEEPAGGAAYLLGSARLLLEDYSGARAAYSRAYEEYPSFDHRGRALLRMGVCDAAEGKISAARRRFSRVRSEFPQNATDTRKATKYLQEMSIVGRPAPPLRADSWLFGLPSEANGLELFRGEPVFLVFFATWCTSCSGELAHMRRLAARWSGKGLVLLGIANPTDPKNTEPVDIYVERNHVGFHDVALDRGGDSWGPYVVSGLPAGVLIDRKGIVRWRGHPTFFPAPLVEAVLSGR